MKLQRAREREKKGRDLRLILCTIYIQKVIGVKGVCNGRTVFVNEIFQVREKEIIP